MWKAPRTGSDTLSVTCLWLQPLDLTVGAPNGRVSPVGQAIIPPLPRL